MVYRFDTIHTLQTDGQMNNSKQTEYVQEVASVQSTKNRQQSQSAASHPKRWRYSSTVC